MIFFAKICLISVLGKSKLDKKPEIYVKEILIMPLTLIF